MPGRGRTSLSISTGWGTEIETQTIPLSVVLTGSTRQLEPEVIENRRLALLALKFEDQGTPCREGFGYCVRY